MTATRRCIGLDVHRDFAQVAIWQGGQVRQAGTFATTPEGVREFAAGLGPADEVALEATGNTWAIATLLASQAARYSLAAVRAAERDLAAQGEAAYRTMVAAWQPARPERKKVTGAAASTGTRLIKPTG